PSMSLANATLQEVYTLSLHDALPILLKQLKLYVVNKDSDANSITYYASGSRKLINRAARLIEEAYPAAEVTVHNVAIVSAIGSEDRKSTRLNSSHVKISYAVFCLKKK